MSPWLTLPQRSLSEALRDRERDRLRDPNLGFRLDRRRNFYVSTYRGAASISPRVSRDAQEPDWEDIARRAAHSMPPSDYGSFRAIHDVAGLLANAYALGKRHGHNEAAANLSAKPE